VKLHSSLKNVDARAKYLILTSLFCLPFTLNAQAFGYENQVDFNVHLQSVKSDWRYDNAQRQTRISRAGFGWSESLGRYLSAGLLLGYLDLSQADNPLDTAKLSSGYYGGLQLDGQIIENRYLKLKLNLSFLYNDTQNQDASQNISNIWTQTEVKLLARIPLSDRLSLRLDLNSYQLRGEQRNSGSVSSINKFNQDQSTGYSAGLDVAVDRNASIGFDWSGGSREGGRIYFRRLF